jgi:tRNA (mo5U34)-methyltransferase
MNPPTRSAPSDPSVQSKLPIEREIRALGEWFHNLELDGVPTAPQHFLGDYPRVKWQRFAHALPANLTGKTVLDVGCNGGFYSIEMKRRGADRVVGIDFDDRYLEQARFAARVSGVKIEFLNLDVYHLRDLAESFDIVLFLGVMYHLRHPLLALDLLREHVVRDTLVVQSMQRGSSDFPQLKDDYPFSERAVFDVDGYPKLHFVEHRYAGDATNWWIPNRACMVAMLHSAGFHIVAHSEEEVYVCRVATGVHPEAPPLIVGKRPPESLAKDPSSSR